METKSKMDFLRGMTESGDSVIALGGKVHRWRLGKGVRSGHMRGRKQL